MKNIKTESEGKVGAANEKGKGDLLDLNQAQYGAWKAFFRECHVLAQRMDENGFFAPNRADLPCEEKE